MHALFLPDAKCTAEVDIIAELSDGSYGAIEVN